MSDRFLAVLEKMVQNNQRIGDIFAAESDYYFKYDSYTWSITRYEKPDPLYGAYSIYFYPKWQGSLADLVALFATDEVGEPLLEYHENQFFSRELSNPFAELFRIVGYRYLGVEEAFDKILDD